MLLRIALLWGVNVVALWLCDRLFDGFDIGGGWSGVVVAALVLALLTFFLKPLVAFLALPLVVLTFGIALFFVSMAMLWLTDLLLGRVSIEGFWTYVGATIVVWIVNVTLSSVLGLDKRSR
jgi:putative membrane protein